MTPKQKLDIVLFEGHVYNLIQALAADGKITSDTAGTLAPITRRMSELSEGEDFEARRATIRQIYDVILANGFDVPN